MIYIRTTAYNASKTLRRAVESVLRQTYEEFQYYLIDNGSVDNGKTRRIVEEYARQDSRIKPFFNKKNHVWDENEEANLLPHRIGAEDYFCLLDADDEYMPTFFEDMLNFMDRYQLDIAASGSDFVRAVDGKFLGQRLLQHDLILYGERFDQLFPIYHQFMRTIWGKMFKGKTLVHTVVTHGSPEMPTVYGNDTFFTTRAFQSATRVGILSKSLHRYYISSKSVSYNFNPDRSKCDRILRKAALDFLKPYGEVSPQNKGFLDCVHANATKDTLLVILNAKMSVLEKMKWIKELFSDEGVTEIVLSSDPEVMRIVGQIREGTLNWIFAQAACGTVEGAELIADIMSCLLPQYDVFTYLLNIQNRRPDFILELKKSEWIEHHLLENPVLNYISADLAFVLPEVIKCVMRGNYLGAWESFLENNDIEINEKDEEKYYLLGQNLAALMEDASSFLYFKKEWISYLIEHMRIEEAKVELSEFAKILPDDETFNNLSGKLENELHK